MKDPYGREVDNLRISVNQECNLDCFYCHKEGQTESQYVMDLDEISTIMDIARESGIRSLKITGGEPLLRIDIEDIVREAGSRFEDVSLVTNGVLLKDLARPLTEAGLKRINVSLDTIDEEVYRQLTGTDRLLDVLSGLEEAKRAGLHPIKINMIMLKDYNDDRLDQMMQFCLKNGFVLQIIEFVAKKASSRAKFYQDHHVDLRAVEQYLERMAERVEVRAMQRRKRYHINKWGIQGVVEVVRPMHNSEFCQNCNRIRVTADGRLKPCLLGDTGLVDMLTPLRQGAGKEQLMGLFEEAVCNRKPYWSEGRISEKELDIPKLIESLRSPKAGCIVTFIGTVRDFNQDRDVVSVEVEAYDDMAEKELQKIIDEAQGMFLLEKVEVKHRSGKLAVGEDIVFIGVSAPHREDGYSACRYIIEELKKRVPLFKKEYSGDGKEVWVKGEQDTDDDGGHN